MGSGCSRCTSCHDHAYFMGPRDPKDIVEEQKFTGQNSFPFSLHGNLLISVKQARGRVFNEDTLMQVRLSLVPISKVYLANLKEKMMMLFQCSNKLPISARKMLYQNLHEPFVTGHLGPDEIFRSGSLKGVRKKGWLRWNQKFSIPVCHRDRFLIIKGELGKFLIFLFRKKNL